MINELPDLNDLDTGGGMGQPNQSMSRGVPGGVPGGMSQQSHIGELVPPGMVDSARKHIRSTGKPFMNESGMTPYNPPNHYRSYENYGDSPSAPNGYYSDRSAHHYHSQPIPSLHCIEIANHIAECPVCKKIYNCNTTIYIAIIIALAIVCLLLLKRVLNV